MGVLRNVKHELFCQNMLAGMTRGEAYAKAGYKVAGAIAPNGLANRPHIKKRMEELLKQSERHAEFSRKEILDRIVQDWDLARKLGQVASALKAAELYGRDVHKMFTERKEVGGPGDFDSKSEAELREIIQKEMQELGWDEETAIIPPDQTIN